MNISKIIVKLFFYFLLILASFASGQVDVQSYKLIQEEINNKPLKKPIRRTTKQTQQLLENIQNKIIPIAKIICEDEVKKNSNLVCEWNIERIIDSEFNAFAYKDDGKNMVILNSGLINNLTYEDEIAFVIAHELGHHIADHINKKVGRSTLGTLLGAAAGSLIGLDPLTGSQIGGALIMGDSSKEYEIESDAIAIKILKEAGYNKDNTEMLFYRFSRKSFGSIYSNYGDSHPSDVERILHLRSKWNE